MYAVYAMYSTIAMYHKYLVPPLSSYVGGGRKLVGGRLWLGGWAGGLASEEMGWPELGLQGASVRH